MRTIMHKGFLRALLFVSIAASYTTQKADAQTVTLDYFCQSYPLNSRCEAYVVENSDRAKQPDLPIQTIRVLLEETGPDNEVVWFEINEETANNVTLSAYHAVKTEGLLNTLLNGAAGAAIPVPLPFDLFEIYDSQPNQTEYLAFTPDSCQTQPFLINGQGLQSPDCSITGIDTISLSKDIDIRSGFFTLGYTEGSLVQTVTFRIEDHDAEFINQLDIDNLCQNYPLNSQCRYWPISQS